MQKSATTEAAASREADVDASGGKEDQKHERKRLDAQNKEIVESQT